MIWLSPYMCCCILMLMSELFSTNNGHITRKGKALKEIVFCACPLTDAHTHMLSRPDSSPFVSRFFFFLLHFSILDNTPRIDIKQKWIINRGQEWTSFQSRERVKSEGISFFKKDGKTDRRGALLSRGFSEPYVGSHRLMGRLVPGLPGILHCTSPNTPLLLNTHFFSPRHPPTPTSPTPPTFTLWKSLLHFPLISPFSLVLTRGGPLYSPLHARSQRCDRSPSPCAGSPSPLLSPCPGCPPPRRLCSIDLLLQPMLSVSVLHHQHLGPSSL